jgi:hypothetical protein
MSLEDWQKFGWLKAHKTNRNEIAELLAVADRDLGASKTPSLHNDWSFNIAYNAALQVATAARQMRLLAEKLRVDFEVWIKKNHPQLRP